MKILFISNTRIGDAILSTGILNYLFEKYPQAQFTIACGEVAAPILKHFPNLNSLYIIKKQPLHKHWLKLWKYCRKTKWHTIVDLRHSGIALLLHAQHRYWKKPKNGANLHRQWQNARLLQLPAPYPLKLWTNQRIKNIALSHLNIDKDCQPIVAIAPAANWHAKTWPIENFIRLIQEIMTRKGPLQNARFAISAAPSEYESIKLLFSAAPLNRFINLIHDISLLEVGECFKHCTLFIGNDSGLMHLACASGVPTIGLFGPTRDDLYAPIGKQCCVVRTPESFKELTGSKSFNTATTPNLMQSLCVESVLDAVNNITNNCLFSNGKMLHLSGSK